MSIARVKAKSSSTLSKDRILKTFSFVPAVCSGDDAKFSGRIVLRVPSVFEKLELSDRYEQLKESKASSSRQTIEMLKSTQEYYKQVELKNLATGEDYKSFEDMITEPLLEMTLVEVATCIFRGARPGEA